MYKIILVTLLCICFSCKKEAESKNVDKLTTLLKNEFIEKDFIFKVLVNIKILEADKIELFFTDSSSNGIFFQNKRLVKNLRGSKDEQTIEFNLPQNIFPKSLRLDLGENQNKNETDIEINSIEFLYNGKSMSIRKELLNYFFQPNIYMEKKDDVYLRKVVNGRYDPFLLAKPVLIKKMELELQL